MAIDLTTLTDDQLSESLYVIACDYYRMEADDPRRTGEYGRWLAYSTEAQRRGRIDLADNARNQARNDLKLKPLKARNP